MKQNSLSPTGLSLSQAQSISNLCNQRAVEIDNKLNNVNNYSKQVESLNGRILTTVVAKPLPTNVVDLLIEKSKLHACQGFLMENIKAKDVMLTEARNEGCDVSSVVFPTSPNLHKPVIQPTVSENWGWEQLTSAEICEYQEAEAHAAHIGQYIHKNGTLDSLRKELPGINPVEWMIIKDGEKTPVIVTTHHTSAQLLEIHEALAKLHREYEQRVNYFKAKVKNLTTLENSRIAKLNSDSTNEVELVNKVLREEYFQAYKKASAEVEILQSNFEISRQENIKKIAVLRISIPARFQDTVDVFLKSLPIE